MSINSIIVRNPAKAPRFHLTNNVAKNSMILSGLFGTIVLLLSRITNTDENIKKAEK